MPSYATKIVQGWPKLQDLGANDASGQGLQSALKNKHKKYFFEEITGILSRVPAIFIENNETVLGDFN